MQGIVSSAARSASRTAWSTESRSTPGIDGTGVPRVLPVREEHRPDQVVRGQRCFAHQAPRPLAPAVAAQAHRSESSGLRAISLASASAGTKPMLVLQWTAEFDGHGGSFGGLFSRSWADLPPGMCKLFQPTSRTPCAWSYLPRAKRRP